MKQPSTILCAVDFSKCSARALDFALDLAEKFGAKVRLVHAYEDPLARVPFGRPGHQGPVAAPAEMIEAAREKRQRQAVQLQSRCEARGAAAKVVELEGDPKAVIGDHAEAIGADLIVMGTHGRTRLARALLGSVAERVVRTGRCPVMTVP